MTLSELAKGYAPEALEMLAEVMRYGVSDSARVAASIAILDRGYGRPKPLESVPASTEIGDWIREIQAKGSKPTLVSDQIPVSRRVSSKVNKHKERPPQAGDQLCLKIADPKE